jgi:hypothetical protein
MIERAPCDRSTARYVPLRAVKGSQVQILSARQRKGLCAASLLSQALDQVEGAEGPQGGEVLVDRHWVGAYPEGAVVLVVVDAGSLEIAESAARGIVLEVLHRSELLAQWLVTSCEVGFDERFDEAGLQVVDGTELPPADPAERARWHAEQRRPASPLEEADWRAWIKGRETPLRAFDLDVFDPGDGDPESALLAAGALMMAATIVIDELFQDVRLLGRNLSRSVRPVGVKGPSRNNLYSLGV